MNRAQANRRSHGDFRCESRPLCGTFSAAFADVMKLSKVLVMLFFALLLATAVDVSAESPDDTCTCVMTIVGDGNHKERHCDGFNPATHAQCLCEKVQVGEQLACEPKGQTVAPAVRAAAKPLPGS